MSQCHPTWRLPLECGALVLMPCPGTKGVGLQASIAQLAQQGVSAIVTAISTDELVEKGVEQLGELAQQHGIAWYHAPIEDDCAPDEHFAGRWLTFNQQLKDALLRGESVALHCMGGSGRTGLLAAHLLLELGWPLEKIISEVQALRPGAFTKPVQLEYILCVAQQA